jgi:alpha-beta hydrolase superfamily lysophospholipase
MREARDHTFSTHDGVQLFYRHWPASNLPADEPRKAVVLFHRGHEHSGRIAHLVDELDLPEFDFFAWDARGHGQSPGARGDSPGFATSVRDVQTFCDHLSASYQIDQENMAVIAQSVGAVIVATWVHDYAPRIRALVLASPAFKVKLYVPFARTGLALMRKFRGNFFVNSYVKARLLSHDRQRVASYDSDPLITKAISVNVLLGLYEAADRVVADAQAIQVPTQLLISGADFVVHRKPQEQFFERLGSLQKEKHILPGFFHDTLGERDRAPALSSAKRFILQNFARPALRPSQLDADRLGMTCAESGSTGGTLATQLAARPVLASDSRQHGPGQSTVGRGQTWLRQRFRLRQHPGLCLPQPSDRAHSHGPGDRSELPELHRLARHSPAQNSPGRTVTPGNGTAP